MYDSIIKYIHALYGTDDFVPLHAATFVGNEKKYLNECIDSSFVSSVGEFVNQFEKIVAEYTGAKKAVVCVNGTNALHLALVLAGIEQTDEVITQPLTFIATANAITYCGANPIFIDVDMDTMGLSPSKMEDWLNLNADIQNGICINKVTGKKIKACIPMHTFGHPVHLDELVSVCAKWHIKLIEDAAESMGSLYKGKHTGTFGLIGVLSFNGNKIITTGGGGILLFNDEKLAAHAKHISTQAKVSHRWEFVHDEIGYNYRMPNINAALGCAQMELLPTFLENKRETAAQYKKFFETQNEIQFFTEPTNCKSNYWLNAVILPSNKAQIAFLTATNDHGIMTRPVWELMNHLPMFANAQCGELSNSEWLAKRVVNIPSSVRK